MQDVADLAPNIREEDLIEMALLRAGDPKTILAISVGLSDKAFTIVDQESKVVAIFGVCSHSTRKQFGVVWLLGSSRLKKLWKSFAQHSMFWVRQLLENHEIIGNVVWRGNKSSIRWLKWLGFRFSIPEGTPKDFLLFSLIKDHVPF